jgi:hypothetical protein
MPSNALGHFAPSLVHLRLPWPFQLSGSSSSAHAAMFTAGVLQHPHSAGTQSAPGQDSTVHLFLGPTPRHPNVITKQPQSTVTKPWRHQLYLRPAQVDLPKSKRTNTPQSHRPHTNQSDRRDPETSQTGGTTVPSYRARSLIIFPMIGHASTSYLCPLPISYTFHLNPRFLLGTLLLVLRTDLWVLCECSLSLDDGRMHVAW